MARTTGAVPCKRIDSIRGSRRRKLLASTAVLGLGVSFDRAASAASTWTNPSSGTYSTAANWSNGVPSDIAYFGSATTNFPTINILSSASVAVIDVLQNGSPTLNMATHTLSTGQINVGGDINGNNSDGVLLLESGTVSDSGGIYLGAGEGSGSLYESNSSISVTCSLVDIGGGTGTGDLNIESGTLTTGAINLTSGSFFATSGNFTSSGITQTGGMFYAPTSWTLGTGTASIAPSYSISSGTLTTGTVNLTSGGTFTYNGGVLSGNTTTDTAATILQTGGTFTDTASPLTLANSVQDVALYSFTAGSFSAPEIAVNTGGEFTTTVGFTVGSSGNTQSLAISGGTFVFGSLTVSNGASVSWSGTSGDFDVKTLNQTGGTLNLGTQALGVTGSIVAGANDIGTYSMSGGTLTNSASASIQILPSGTLALSGGALVSSPLVEVGTSSGGSTGLSTPLLTIDATHGATSVTAGSFEVGGNSVAGMLEITNGGQLICSGDAEIGETAAAVPLPSMARTSPRLQRFR